LKPIKGVNKPLSLVEAKKRSLQQKVQRFLNEEQKLMEERIRTFTEQEHSRFAEMQLKIGQNEESLYELLDEIGDKLNLKSDNDKSFSFSTEQTILKNGNQFFFTSFCFIFKTYYSIFYYNNNNKSSEKRITINFIVQ
jgi:uncharacterized protein YukE